MSRVFMWGQRREPAGADGILIWLFREQEPMRYMPVKRCTARNWLLRQWRLRSAKVRHRRAGGWRTVQSESKCRERSEGPARAGREGAPSSSPARSSSFAQSGLGSPASGRAIGLARSTDSNMDRLPRDKV